MAIERWDPFREAISLRDAMNHLFQESFVRSGPDGQPSGGVTSLPLDVRETPEAFVVHASLPGLTPDQVQITVHGETVTIRGEHKAETSKDEGTWHLRERRSGAFQRTLNLAVPVDANKADAKFEHGVLTLTLPKSEQARPKQIKVSGGSAKA
jgi:HSP20 family protein